MIIMITTSSLHSVNIMQEVTSPFHLEVESICGAGIPELARNWSGAYGESKVRQTVILVGGCNDIMKYNISDADSFMLPVATL